MLPITEVSNTVELNSIFLLGFVLGAILASIIAEYRIEDIRRKRD